MAEYTVQTVSACRIERVIKCYKDGSRYADFFVQIPARDNDQWCACSVHIYPFTDRLTPEQAAALATALQMAIEWIAKEQAVRP